MKTNGGLKRKPTVIDRDTAMKQWEICPRCGRKKTPEDMSFDPLSRLSRQSLRTESLLTKLLSCPQCLPKDAEEMVPIGDLEHGAYYFGTCRNATVARWNSETQRFVYVRVKFDAVFPEEIGYWVDAQPREKRFDEFRPYGKMENPPFEIPMKAEHGKWVS
jgi:hypothetical protein